MVNLVTILTNSPFTKLHLSRLFLVASVLYNFTTVKGYRALSQQRNSPNTTTTNRRAGRKRDDRA